MRSLLRPLTFHLLVTQPLFLAVSVDLYSNITAGEKNSKTEKNPPLVGLVILIVQHERAASVSHKAASSL